MMLPILICSVVALAIVVERFWTLRPSKLAPADTLAQVRVWLQKGQLNAQRLAALHEAVREGHMDGIRQQAHSFKGSSGNLGALRVSALCLEMEQLAREEPNVQRFTDGKTVRKVIVIPGKLVNIVAN